MRTEAKTGLINEASALILTYWYTISYAQRLALLNRLLRKMVGWELRDLCQELRASVSGPHTDPGDSHEG
jgi:hypothetical protein